MTASVPRPQSEAPFDVAIVGAGPTGLALAHLLGALGLRVVLIERQAGVQQIPRAVHIDGETMRVFQAMGLATRLLSVMRPGGAMHWVNPQGQTLLVREGLAGLGPQGWHNDYYFHQPDLEAVLRDALGGQPGVQLLASTRLLRYQQDAGGVTLQCVDSADQALPALRARYLVGCDGARSTVRGHWGSGEGQADDHQLEDLGSHPTWLVVDAVLHRPLRLPEHTVQHCDPARPATSVYVQTLRRRWELMLLPDEDPQALCEPERVWQLLSRWIKPSQGRLERAATYSFHALVARRWQQGRVFIAGDAAHQTPPFLGQGLCAGIRDAANLGWKLAFAVRHPAQANTLLNTYGPERRPHARAFVQLAVDVGEVIQELDPTKAAQRDARLVREGSVVAFPQPRLGPGCHLARDNMPAVGQLAPQFELPDGRWIDDVVGLRWALLVDGAALGGVASNGVAGDGVAGVGLSAMWSQTAALGLVVVDNAGPLAQDWLAAQGAVAALIRPDRYVYEMCSDEAAMKNALAALQALLQPA